jgi:hypothetical protein
VKASVAAEVKDKGEGVGRIPTFGKVREEVHVGVALQQAAEKKAVDALGLRVGADARVEIGGHGFDEKGNGLVFGRGGDGTSGEGQYSE